MKKEKKENESILRLDGISELEGCSEEREIHW